MYYKAESRHVIIGMATGIVMLLVTILLWCFSNAQSINESQSFFLAGGLITG
jgi:hypothetical protein